MICRHLSGFLSFLLLLARVLSGPADERVDLTQLPGIPQEFKGSMYSGYIPIPSSDKHYHYIFIESQNSPLSDPVVLWLTGGPGCSSLYAMLYGHGPFIFKPLGTELIINPYSWHQKANILYLESPAGVGFSYSPKQEELEFDDGNTASDSLAAVLGFFEKYHEYKRNDFFISGESYAGVYVPWLALKVLNHNADAPTASQIQLKGILVGNGATDWSIDCSPAEIDYFYMRALYGYSTKAKLNDCFRDPQSALCLEAVKDISSFIDKVNICLLYTSPSPRDQA
eukprot:TRINITY_DN9084_c0_g1_i1.p1 TRINITY_DN9084_c0_g1~~TRINITY_DN9084_c0_g1_i1.p1  ORF type:complete len:283 (-),score=19.43 TRINITY_DN9084_c0_g1_i1:35-883(-)